MGSTLFDQFSSYANRCKSIYEISVSPSLTLCTSNSLFRCQDKNEGNNNTISTLESNDLSPSTEASQDNIDQDNSTSKTLVTVESKTTFDGTKSATPTSAPDEDESTMTRISECSDDSNLIKLDLSQLVGEPNTTSDDTKEVETTKSDVKNEEELSPGKMDT